MKSKFLICSVGVFNRCCCERRCNLPSLSPRTGEHVRYLQSAEVKKACPVSRVKLKWSRISLWRPESYFFRHAPFMLPVSGLYFLNSFISLIYFILLFLIQSHKRNNLIRVRTHFGLIVLHFSHNTTSHNATSHNAQTDLEWWMFWMYISKNK